MQETQNDTNDVDPTVHRRRQLLGLHDAQLLRAGPPLLVGQDAGRPDARVEGDGQGLPRRRHQGLHRRGLQPHRRGRRLGRQRRPHRYNLQSWRGLDNPTYYSLTNDLQYSWDNTGVGGNYNTRNPVAQNLIVDSLAYWRDTLGVDGFRFDLASVLGNTCQHGCFNFDKMDCGQRAQPHRRPNCRRGRPRAAPALDLIAEPWAIGGNSYQVGDFPDRLGGVERHLPRLAAQEAEQARRRRGARRRSWPTASPAPSDLYGDDGRKPWHSVNFMVAHDGFTLNDLYACNAKQNNQPWPYGPSDGGDDNNHSWDQGGVAADQRKAARTGLAFLMLSAGVPMITGGDEALRTQFGNNNPYNLDSSANWLLWTRNTDRSQLTRPTRKRLIAFRKAHPALRPANFYSGVDNNGNVMEQLRWFKPDGAQADDGLLQQRQQPRHRLADRRQRVRRSGQRDLRGLQRLVRAT